jgi:hypothetical protein
MEIAHKVKRKIDYRELFKPFEKENKEKFEIQKGTLNNGTYVARYRWKMEGLSHDEQFLWILYAETYKQIKEVVDEYVGFTEKANAAGIVEIAPEVFAKDLPAQIYFFCDGQAWVHYLTTKVRYNADIDEGNPPIKGKVEGYIGVITGQGRYLDLNDAGITAMLCILLAYAFPKKRDKFFRYFRWKLWRVLNYLKDSGANVQGIEQIRW